MACGHPVEVIPSIEEPTEPLKKMNADERNRWYDARDVDAKKRITIDDSIRKK